MNLLTNAIDAIEEQFAQLSAVAKQHYVGCITIRTSIIDSNWVEIVIADNGVGMSKEVQQRIFNPFFTTKSVGKGTGLGMSISYKILIENHRGKLTCVSKPGEGTEFLIQIPLTEITSQ